VFSSVTSLAKGQFMKLNKMRLMPLLLLLSSHSVFASQALIDAAKSGDVAEVTRLLNLPGENVNELIDDRTALHWAAWNGHIEVVRILIGHGANVSTFGLDNNTPLHLVAWEGRTGVAQFLIGAGAKVDALNSFNSTPLHLAAIWGRTEVAHILIDHGANTDAVDEDGNTPLSRAEKNKYHNVETAQVLREAMELKAARAIAPAVNQEIDAETPLPPVLTNIISGYLTGLDAAKPSKGTTVSRKRKDR
jgi:ankyrin repeat protein